MPQFDFLVIFPLIWSLLITLVLYYSLSIKILIPLFFGVRKFREKKIAVLSFSKFFKKNPEIQKNVSYLSLF
jgi:hypothetical protein